MILVSIKSLMSIKCYFRLLYNKLNQIIVFAYGRLLQRGKLKTNHVDRLFYMQFINFH